jgi:hypothetical protein
MAKVTLSVTAPLFMRGKWQCDFGLTFIAGCCSPTWCWQKAIAAGVADLFRCSNVVPTGKDNFGRHYQLHC